MKKILLFALAGCLGLNNANAQLLDQSNTAFGSSGWLVNTGGYINLGQSFTAGISGQLQSISISIDNSNTVYPPVAGTFALIIKSGDGFGGATLATENFFMPSTVGFGDFNIPITTTVNLIAGNQYSFYIDEVSGTGQMLLRASNDVYSGGILYFNSTIAQPTYDMLFKTYMYTANTFSTINVATCGSYTSPSGNYTWSADGTYIDTIPNSSGADSIITVNLLVTSIIDQSVSASTSSICNGDSSEINLTSTELNTVYYLRDDSDNSIVAGPYLGDGNSTTFNTGALTSTTTYNVYATNLLGAVNLPNSADDIHFSTPFYSYGNSITIESWVYFDGSTQPWAGQGTVGADNMTANVWLWHSGTFYVNDNGNWRFLNFPSSVPTGWTHVATVADNTGMYIYYNGSLVANNTTASSIISSTIRNNSSSSITLGVDVRYPTDPGRNSNCAFDNFAVWSSSRNASEIASDVNACLVGNESGLVQYTQFNEKEGNNIYSVKGSNGIIENPSTNWINGSGICDNVCDFEMTNTVTITVLQPTSSIQTISSCGNYLWNGNLLSTSGTYFDTIANVAGCDSAMTLNLTIDNIDLSVTNSSPTLTAVETGASYQWLNCGTGFSAIGGATSQSFTATVNGTYAVVISSGACVDTSACEIVTGLGLNAFDLTSVSIYPNPSTGKFTLDVAGLEGEWSYRITSADGRVVKNVSQLNSSRIEIDLNNESTGIYVLSLINGKANANFRLIKE